MKPLLIILLTFNLSFAQTLIIHKSNGSIKVYAKQEAKKAIPYEAK